MLGFYRIKMEFCLMHTYKNVPLSHSAKKQSIQQWNGNTDIYSSILQPSVVQCVRA